MECVCVCVCVCVFLLNNLRMSELLAPPCPPPMCRRGLKVGVSQRRFTSPGHMNAHTHTDADADADAGADTRPDAGATHTHTDTRTRTTLLYAWCAWAKASRSIYVCELFVKVV